MVHRSADPERIFASAKRKSRRSGSFETTPPSLMACGILSWLAGLDHPNQPAQSLGLADGRQKPVPPA
jgi:hypothetical protein